MKNFLASALLLAAATSASAAVVNISWTGGGWTFTGTLNVGSNTGTITEATSGITGTMSASDGVNNAFTGGTVNIDIASSQFSFNLAGNTATETAASLWYLSDISGNNVLAGTVGLADWSLSGDDFNPALATEADTLSLTVVPEPETYAAVAGAGLVAFGLFRRRAVKA